MSYDVKIDTERRETDYRALIDKREISYSDIALKVREITGEYVSITSVYRTANPNDKYTNPKILNALTIILGGTMTQWERLLQYLKRGNSITAFGCFEVLGFTQLHARLLEIQKHAGYVMQEEGKERPRCDGTGQIASVIFWGDTGKRWTAGMGDCPDCTDKIIYSRWIGKGRGKYKEYYIKG